MPALSVPESGLLLRRGELPGQPVPDASGKPIQVLRLNLAQSTLDELIQCLRDNQKARIRLGKHHTLYYGTKSQSFHSSVETHRSELYRAIPSNRNNVYFAGVVSHRLEVQKAKEATAATDEALASLEQKLSAFERGKESKRTPMITDIQGMRALGAGDSRSATGRQAAKLARMPATKIDREKERFFQQQSAANRSISNSPGHGLGASRTSTAVSVPPPPSTPTPQSKQKMRLEALRVPFIHLLAVRAVSLKFLAKTTRSSTEDCRVLIQKYGVKNRFDKDKFDLKDRYYKELDVWNFPYPSQDDRQQAIENAISAFDRLRISRSDALWQKLLPKEERGKGKCLSRLNLQTGPMQKPTTPRIRVVSSDESKEGDAGHGETDRVTASGGTAPGKKQTGEKKATATKKATSAKSKGTTVSGRVTKKTERKGRSKNETKYKSAEFVHDSDVSDTEMVDAPPQPTQSSDKGATKASGTEADKAMTKAKADAKPTAKTAASESRPSTRPPSQQSSVKTTPNATPATSFTSSKTLGPSSRPRPPSPAKPSPALSPSMNGADADASGRPSSRASSTSSSPLMNQLSKQPRPNAVSKSKTAAKANGTARPQPERNKRQAESESTGGANRLSTHASDAKRQCADQSMSPSGISSGSASPPMSRELLRQRLREKSMLFKRYYAKYRALHDTLAKQTNPPKADLDRLMRQHARLERMKKEIWDEDRRLRSL